MFGPPVKYRYLLEVHRPTGSAVIVLLLLVWLINMRKQRREEGGGRWNPLDKFVMTESLLESCCPPSPLPPNCYLQPSLCQTFLLCAKIHTMLSVQPQWHTRHALTDTVTGESLTEMTNLSSEGSDLREGTQAPPEHSDFSQDRDREHE